MTNVPAYNLQLLEHTDITNIPIDVETYCKELEAGLTTENIVSLTRPQALSPLHKELLYWNHHLYLMPNHCLIKLFKEHVIQHRLAALKEKMTICASYHFGRTHKRPWQKRANIPNLLDLKMM